MAVTLPALQSALLSTKMAGIHIFGGPTYDQLATAVATAVFQWGIGNPINLALKGNASGTSGVGTIPPFVGKFVLPPDVDAMMKGLKMGDMNGPLALSLATSITLGLSGAFSTLGQYAGVSPTVGIGADVSQPEVVNRTTLKALLMLHLMSMLGPGPALINMATGLSEGIANLFDASAGAGAVVGVPTIPPIPSTGTTFSVVF